MNDVFWEGLPFKVCDFNGAWPDVGGVYIFAGLNPQNQWVPAYIGQTGSFRTCIPSHEKWPHAAWRGATHVHARVVEQEAEREEIERNLVDAIQPPLNPRVRGSWFP
jgi:mannose/cellobiose epimerase-like protein (N-acyl-D-glucosamine 2-epimerase family)